MPVEIIHLALVDGLSAETVLSSTLDQEKTPVVSSGVNTSVGV